MASARAQGSGTTSAGTGPGRRTASTPGGRPTFGQALVAAIAADGRPVSEIAMLLGASRANVELWCDDVIDPWPENFDALTVYLGIDMDELGSLMIRSQVLRATGAGRYSGTEKIAN